MVIDIKTRRPLDRDEASVEIIDLDERDTRVLFDGIAPRALAKKIEVLIRRYNRKPERAK